MKTELINIKGENDRLSRLEISDANLATYLSAQGVPFKLAEPKVLSGDRIEIRFIIERSKHVNDLIAAYVGDQPIEVGAQTFFKASKLVKDVMMQAVRAAKVNCVQTTTR